MPELPEVETTRRGIAPALEQKTVTGVLVRQPGLRWPVPDCLQNEMKGKKLLRLERRGKYLLFGFDHGSLILHLGMSGSLRLLAATTPAEKHDHVDILFGETCLRYRDPRRFGALLWTTDSPESHKLLKQLGPEPLSAEFTTDYLYGLSRNRRISIKSLIMDSKVVVGVGNIYANESLFMAGIRPARRCDRISRERIGRLTGAIKQVLEVAINQGGTTLQDFHQADGNPGYFAQSLRVYDRQGEPCQQCGAPILRVVIGQRSTFFCPHCQR